MKPAKGNTTIVDAYASLLGNLSADDKLALISRLGEKDELPSHKRKSSFRKAFGAFVSDKSADEIIEDVRNSRVATRQIEPF